ncbi:chad domain-containing protein: PROVISIONAL [Gigaspora margarita]|uniref:Chad domain-containing protein: PROVISIONAL n=1 Tax=Gigaspora margarita TaxID=4874 RepID=A0A8H4EM45_GIGMA|nr:chad domain-containing protein: PROVISIONAL [Gigaspora margarita]
MMYKKKGKRTNIDTSVNFNTLKYPKQLDDQGVKSDECRTSISSKPTPSASASTSSVTTLTSVASATIRTINADWRSFKKFEIIDEFNNVKKGKGKKSLKNLADFCFQNVARKLAHELIHSHVQISDERIKEQLKEMLESDKECTEQLQKLNDKGVPFNTFWNNKLYSEVMLAAIRLKKGYYIRHIKEGLWSTFGINRVKPFSEKDTKEQMREWKKNSKKAYKDLYNSSDLDNPNSDTFLLLIIKYVFVFNKECTQANAIWTQAVLETIFDEEYLLPKIDADVINMWIQKLNVEGNEDNTVLQKSSASFSAISEAAIQKNYEVSSGDGSENDCRSDSNYEK